MFGFKKRGDGKGVDSHGGPVVDPTENVRALTEASNIRQDDLRDLNNRRIDAELRRVDTDIKRLEDLETLRGEHFKEIRQLESDRLDKIRQVDVLAGNTAADRALVAIQTLAATTQANADTLRAMVANTATTIAAQTSETVAGLTGRIAQLEKSSYEGAGRQAYADPMVAELVQQVKMLTASGAGTAGQSAGAKNLWALLAGVIILIFGASGLILTALGIVVAIILKK